ncbi:MAG: hypothetical protein JXA43_00315 [Candidatus Diapherotrites archaeon]|nr:hypothetical protein [Candidatus Diapherotrites archaeon]
MSGLQNELVIKTEDISDSFGNLPETIEQELILVDSKVNSIHNKMDQSEVEPANHGQVQFEFFDIVDKFQDLKKDLDFVTGCDCAITPTICQFVRTTKEDFGFPDCLHILAFEDGEARLTLQNIKNSHLEKLIKDVVCLYHDKRRTKHIEEVKQFTFIDILPSDPEKLLSLMKEEDFKKTVSISFFNPTQKGKDWDDISIKGPMILINKKELWTKPMAGQIPKNYIERFYQAVRENYPDEAEELIENARKYFEYRKKEYGGYISQKDQAKIEYLMDKVARKEEIAKNLELKERKSDANWARLYAEEKLAEKYYEEMEQSFYDSLFTPTNLGNEVCMHCTGAFRPKHVKCSNCGSPLPEENSRCKKCEKKGESYYRVCPLCEEDIDVCIFDTEWHDKFQTESWEKAKEKISLMGPRNAVRLGNRPDLVDFIGTEDKNKIFEVTTGKQLTFNDLQGLS